MRGFERLTLPAVLVILSAILVVSVYLSFTVHSLWVMFGGLAVVVVVAVLFLWDYSSRPLHTAAPMAPSSTASGAAGTGEPTVTAAETGADEEFDDPVIEADQIASGEVLPDVVEDDAETPPTPTPGTLPPAAP
ncbi:MAG TPA: hypothetical protein VGV89_07390 [Thermoplasmata archaeon]|nr:hypothetical protein [Thermoplasmata archaeon]